MARDAEYIMTLLQEYGMVTPEQISQARISAAEDTEERDAIDFLIEMQAINEEELLAMLA